MQVMYAVRLKAIDPDHDATWAQLVEEVKRWAWRAQVLPAYAQEPHGQAEAGHRALAWSTISLDDGRRLWQLKVKDSPNVHGVSYQTSVSVARDVDEAVLFMTLARVTSGARLIPVPIGEFRPPALVSRVLSRLACRVGTQLATSVALRVRAAGIPALIAALRDPGRELPVIVVSTTDAHPESLALVDELARVTSGLAHVVRLDSWLALDALQDRLPDARLPLHGVRLFWPGFGSATDRLRHPYWTADAVRQDRQGFTHSVFQKLARLSTLALARDEVAEKIREADRETQTARTRQRLAAAENAGDLVRLNTELRHALAREENYVQELWERNEALEQEVQSLRAYKENYHALIADWTTSPESEQAQAEGDSPTDTGDRDFRELWKRLEDESDGAIVFTENARESWAKCPYPYPDRMRQALTKLSHAAAQWRALRGRMGKSLTSWITEVTGLTYAADDEAMRRLKINRFEFEGRVFDRRSHIKVDDHVSPDRVGRIYFGIDKDTLRWIVDHVGTKLHNVSRS